MSRAKSELLVNNLLCRKGFEAFAPTFLERRRYSDRFKNVKSALFPGYVFCRFCPEIVLPIITTLAAYRILAVDCRPAFVSPIELNMVRRAVSFGLACPAPYFSVGRKVRIEFGPLAGVEGFVVTLKGADRLILNVEILRRAVAVEVDLDHVIDI